MLEFFLHYARYLKWGVLLAALALAYWRGASDVQRQWDFAEANRAAESARAELMGWRSEAVQLAGISSRLELELAELRAAEPRIIERYNRVTVEKPLPADCRLGPDRLRELNAAIAAANAAGQPDPGAAAD